MFNRHSQLFISLFQIPKFLSVLRLGSQQYKCRSYPGYPFQELMGIAREEKTRKVPVATPGEIESFQDTTQVLHRNPSLVAIFHPAILPVTPYSTEPHPHVGSKRNNQQNIPAPTPMNQPKSSTSKKGKRPSTPCAALTVNTLSNYIYSIDLMVAPVGLDRLGFEAVSVSVPGISSDPNSLIGIDIIVETVSEVGRTSPE